MGAGAGAFDVVGEVEAEEVVYGGGVGGADAGGGEEGGAD